jgi:hypothetical protein
MACLAIGGVMAACLAAAPAQAQPASTANETVSRVAERNRKTRIWRSFGINPDCSTIRGFNVRVDRLPKHGVAALEKTTMTIDESFITMRSSREDVARIRGCFGKEVPIIAVYYAPTEGFSGFDDMRMAITSANRQRQRIVEFRIAVR